MTNLVKELKNAVKEEEDKLQSSMDSLKEKDLRFNLLKSQCDSQLEKMETELNEVKGGNKTLHERLGKMEEDKRFAYIAV